MIYPSSIDLFICKYPSITLVFNPIGARTLVVNEQVSQPSILSLSVDVVSLTLL